MKARHQRLGLLLAALGLLGAAAWLVLSAFGSNLVFFHTPSQVAAGQAPAGRPLRVGGLVEPGSLRREPDGLTVYFTITDTAQRLPVRYRGALPDLFREGKGVVAQGRLLAALAPSSAASSAAAATSAATSASASASDWVFQADEVLAKHDENYMPPEAGEALRQAGAGTGLAGALR